MRKKLKLNVLQTNYMIIYDCLCLNLYSFLYINALIWLIYFQGKGTGSGHRTLLYGNAILLRHHNSDMVSMPRHNYLIIGISIYQDQYTNIPVIC